MKFNLIQNNRISLTVMVLLAMYFGSCTNAQESRKAEDAKGLSPGTKAPIFQAKDHNNKEYSLESALENGPVVVIFYRGHWCPICSRHLSALQDSLYLISATGATVVAISPEKPELAQLTAEKAGAEFTLLFDEGYKIAEMYDVHFLPDSAERDMYNERLGADLDNAHTGNRQELPVPATYIINEQGVITWRHFDPNYKNRASVKDILRNLP